MLDEKNVGEKDKLDWWQFRIFKWVLFLLFLIGIYKLLDVELHITQFLFRLLAKARIISFGLCSLELRELWLSLCFNVSRALSMS
jgi:hypothetical protein